MINQRLENNIVSIYGSEGRLWLNNLKNKVERLCDQHEILNTKEFDNLSFNYVMAGNQYGKPIILKLGMDIDALARESACLNAYSGLGAVKLLHSEPGMLLMEQAIPGRTLKEYFIEKDEAAIDITCEMLRELHKAKIPEQHNFNHISELLNTLDKDLDIPTKYLTKARQIRDQLLDTMGKEVLLHGDLHHENILKNGNEWLAIDPKGFIGEAEYEVCAFIRNPYPDLVKNSNVGDVINKRIEIFAENLRFSENRLHHWFFVQGILCWAWVLEDNIDSSYIQKIVGEIYEKV